MSTDSFSQIKIISKASSSKGKIYEFIAGDTKFRVGYLDMYKKFNKIFDSNADKFFLDDNGFYFLKCILEDIKCIIYYEAENKSGEYQGEINKFFGLIVNFMMYLRSHSSSDLRQKYFFFDINSKMEKMGDCEIITNSFKSIIRIISMSESISFTNINDLYATSNEESIEKTKLSLIANMNQKDIQDDLLSPINSSVFSKLKKYCINYIGEGTKEELIGSNNIVLKNAGAALMFLKTLFTFSQISTERNTSKMKSRADEELSFNSNKKSNVNKVLFVLFVQKPILFSYFFKIFKKLENSVDEQTKKNILELSKFFNEENLPYTCEFVETDKYLGGSISSNSSIFNRNGENVKVNFVLIKSFMDLMNEEFDPTNGDRFFSQIQNDEFNEIKSDFTPDWWQKLFLEKTYDGESLLLVGDTSGGKTVFSILAVIKILRKYVNEKCYIVYLTPTDQLAVQTFSNIIKKFPENTHQIGICSESIVDIPLECKILIGTPREVRDYLFKPKFKRDQEELTIENISGEVEKCINSSKSREIKILIIDEIQTYSPTYAQNQSVEQKMTCKAIEEVMSAVSYSVDNQSQIIGLSATLSDESIRILKNKISDITGITEISEIKYGFNDIGLKNIKDRDTHIPIMKRQQKFPIKLSNQMIEKYDDSDTIVEHKLDSNALEKIIRYASSREVLPFAFYRESELKTISMFQSFIAYLETKNASCYEWNEIGKNYNRSLESSGAGKIVENRELWLGAIKEKINSISTSSVYAEDNSVIKDDFKDIFETYNRIVSSVPSDILRFDSVILSPELYGLIYEYINIYRGNLGFTYDIHPYYRFGNNQNIGEYFSITDSSGVDTVFKQLLVAQNADPTKNTGSIIPLILRGIHYGVGLITSTIPLGFQLEIFKFINISSKKVGKSSPIPILFCEYGMSMGVNFSTIGGCICREKLEEISSSEYKQINGRFGRRGAEGTGIIQPITFTFNISNVYNLNELESLTFNLGDIKSDFFSSDILVQHLCKIIMKYNLKKDEVLNESLNNCDEFILGDSFINIGDLNTLLVRRAHLSRYQIRELFDKCRCLFPSISNNILKTIYYYLQRCEFYSLNIQMG
jgi:hypothetical protein